MKTILFFILFSVIEYILLYLITNWICIVNYEYASLKYTAFRFSTTKDSPTGLNMLLKVFFPPSYIVVLSGILYELEYEGFVNNIFIVTVIYYLIKWLICIFVLNRRQLINWGNEFLCFGLSLGLSFGVYKYFISKTENIFISFEQLRDGIWMAIISFFFGIFITFIYNQAKLNLSRQRYNVKKYINKQYKKLSDRFSDLIETDNVQLKNLTYSIMIYENYNRPKIIRFFEYIKFYITGFASLGVMQVSTEKYINDEESVERGYAIIKEEYELLLDTRIDEFIQNQQQKEVEDNLDKNNESNEEKTEDVDTDSVVDEIIIDSLEEDDIRRVISIYNKGEKYIEEVMFIYCLLQKK